MAPISVSSEDSATLGRPAPAVVLVRPQEEGNIGSVARAMANMGLTELILVEPAPRVGGIARGFGVGGWHVLDGAHRVADLASALAPFHRAVGTSSGRGRPMKDRRVLEAHHLAAFLAEGRRMQERVAIVFGCEDSGLRRDELELCDPLVRIHCAVERPTLNLAQAVLLVAYELHLAGAGRGGGELTAPDVDPGRAVAPSASEPPTFAARQQLLDRCPPLLEMAGFDQPHLQSSMMRDLRRLLEKAEPDARQVGVLRRVVERVLGLRRRS